jgi:ribosomal protein S27AE
MDDVESAEAIGWARPWAIAKPFVEPTPRAGAWYPILEEADDDQVVLEIRGERVAVQRHLVEIREKRPDKFTVVNRPKNEEPLQTGELGRRYAVCPSCNARVPLWGEPARITCGTCHHKGEVAYWETG